MANIFINFKNTYFEKHLRTDVSVHFKIKRRIQHLVNYLRCFWKKLLVRYLTVENTCLVKKAFKVLSFIHSFFKLFKAICNYLSHTKHIYTTTYIQGWNYIHPSAVGKVEFFFFLTLTFSGSSFDSFSTSMNYSIFAKRTRIARDQLDFSLGD